MYTRRNAQSSGPAGLYGLALLLSAGAVAAQDPAWLDEDEPEERGSFLYSGPDTRTAAELAMRVENHLEAERYGEALHDLQRMLEDHEGDVLSPRWRDPDDGTTLYPNYPGAAEWASRQLERMPERAQ